MNKLDRYDARRLIEAKTTIASIRDYNYTSESNRLYKKLNTICNKIDKILDTELEPEVQLEYSTFGRI